MLKVQIRTLRCLNSFLHYLSANKHGRRERSEKAVNVELMFLIFLG